MLLMRESASRFQNLPADAQHLDTPLRNCVMAYLLFIVHSLNHLRAFRRREAYW